MTSVMKVEVVEREKAWWVESRGGEGDCVEKSNYSEAARRVGPCHSEEGESGIITQSGTFCIPVDRSSLDYQPRALMASLYGKSKGGCIISFVFTP